MRGGVQVFYYYYYYFGGRGKAIYFLWVTYEWQQWNVFYFVISPNILIASGAASTRRAEARVTLVGSASGAPEIGRASIKPHVTQRRSSRSLSITMRSSAWQLGHTAPATNRGRELGSCGESDILASRRQGGRSLSSSAPGVRRDATANLTSHTTRFPKSRVCRVLGDHEWAISVLKARIISGRPWA